MCTFAAGVGKCVTARQQWPLRLAPQSPWKPRAAPDVNMEELSTVMRAAMASLACIAIADDAFKTYEPLVDAEWLWELTILQFVLTVGILTANIVSMAINGCVIYTLYVANWDLLRTLALWYIATQALQLGVPIGHILLIVPEDFSEIWEDYGLYAVFSMCVRLAIIALAVYAWRQMAV